VNHIDSSAGIREGEVIAGKYRVDRILGSGGMGIVVAAHHLELDEKVAIKVLLPDMLANSEAVSRFAREARAAVKIKNEHVARVLDVGRLDNGAPYFVMEYLEGVDLRAWLHLRGALDVEQAVEFLLQACEAIAEAHALGIVHRDLKPANLFVVRRADGLLSVKVLDFGISKLMGLGTSGSDMSVTKTSSVIGSPLYMSPEQLQSSRTVDARTDIWSLGIILYELLSGAPPFQGETLTDVCFKIATQQPTPLRTMRPAIPQGIEEIFSKCIEREREKRYGDVAELAAVLMEFAPKRARASVDRITRTIQNAGLSSGYPFQSVAPAVSASSTATHTDASWGGTAAPLRQRKIALVVASAVGTVILAALVAAALLRQKDTTPKITVVATAPATAPTASSGDAEPPATPEPSTPAEPAQAAPNAATADEPPAPAVALATAPPKATAKPKPTPAPAVHSAATSSTPAPKPSGRAARQSLKSSVYDERK